MQGLPGVSETIVDGGLGILPPNAQIQGVVGNSAYPTAEEIVILGSPREAINLLVTGTALEKILDIFAVRNAPSKVYYVKPDMTGAAAADDGVATQTSGTGNATCVSGGTPTCDRHFRLVVTQGASADVVNGKYRLSDNEGHTYGDEKSFPASGSPITLPDGATITFTNSGTPPELVVDDVWQLWVKESKATTAKILDAITVLTNDRDVTRVYVTEGVDATFAASVSTGNAVLLANHQYITWVLEAITKTSAQTTAEWITAIRAEWASYYDYTVCVNAGFGFVADIRGNVRWHNLGGILCGLRGSAKVHESIGWVRGFPIPVITGLYPIDLSDTQIETLHDDRFTVFRYWDGHGFRCVRVPMMHTETSDFQRLEWVEVLYKAVRLVRAKAIPWVEGTGAPEDLIAFQEDIKQGPENMKTAGEIYDYALSILDSDVLGTGELPAHIVIQPTSIIKNISLTFGLGRVS